MTYDQAYKIGDQPMGFVKCTFAKVAGTEAGIYNKKLGQRFSFHKAHIHKEATWVDADDENIKVTEEFPIVISLEKADGDNVPVVLTNQAYSLMSDKSKHVPFEPNQIVWVKKSAIDWKPTIVNGVKVIGSDGKEIDLTAAIKAAKKKVATAKALLAMASATIII